MGGGMFHENNTPIFSTENFDHGGSENSPTTHLGFTSDLYVLFMLYLCVLFGKWNLEEELEA